MNALLLCNSGIPFKRDFTWFFLLLAIAPCSIFAQTFTAEAQGYNIFLEEDFTFGGGDVEGAVALGNNLTIQGNQGQFTIHSPGTFTPIGFASPVGLVVGNEVSLNGGGVRLLNTAKICIGSSTNTDAFSQENGNPANTRIVPSGGSYSSTPNINLDHSQGESVYQSSPIDFTSAFASLKSRSATTGSLATNMTITNANGNTINPTSIPNNSQIYIQSLGAGTNILNLTGANMNKINSITFNDKPAANKFLIINIDKPGTFNWSNFNFTGVGSTEAQYILLNFTNATKVNINDSRTVYATVFAPSAAVTKNNSNNIDGQVIAKSYTMTQGGEVHKMYYLGDDPSGSFPVEWGDFEVEALGSTSLLTWSTLTESNSSHFVIERSLDAAVYAPVGQVDAAGESKQALAYQFTDHAVAVETNIVYYRLAQIDLDGSISYSAVRSVRMNASPTLTATCHPNPTSNWVNLSWESSENLHVQVLNIQGQVLSTHRFFPTQRDAQLDLSVYPAGRYILQLTTTTQVELLSVYRN